MISIIVPALNEQDTLGACIEALLKQEGLSVPYEIIVVDDGSIDALPRSWPGCSVTSGSRCPCPERCVRRIRMSAHQPAVASSFRLVSGPGRGAGAARNLGASEARGDLLLFTDADCRPVPWLGRGARAGAVDDGCGRRRRRSAHRPDEGAAPVRASRIRREAGAAEQ